MEMSQNPVYEAIVDKAQPDGKTEGAMCYFISIIATIPHSCGDVSEPSGYCQQDSARKPALK